MPSFNKRNGQYQIRFKRTGQSPKEKSESLPIDTARSEVKRIEGEMNAAYHSGDWNPWEQTWRQFKAGETVGGCTVGEAMDDYFYFKESNNHWGSQKTIYNNRQQVEEFCEIVGKRRDTTHISNKHIIAYFKQKDIAKTTAKTYYVYIMSFIHWLQDRGFNDNRFDYTPEKTQKKSILHYTERELNNLIEYFKEIRTYHTLDYIDIWKLMYYQCLRAGEVFYRHKSGAVGIRPQDIQSGQVTIFGKGDKIRTIPIVAPIKDMLLERKYEAGKSGSNLFSLISHQAIYKFTKKIVKSKFPAHREDLDLHSLRRGGGVYWSQKGIPIAAIKELMGHSSVVTTEKHYARFQPDGMMSVFG